MFIFLFLEIKKEIQKRLTMSRKSVEGEYYF